MGCAASTQDDDVVAHQSTTPRLNASRPSARIAQRAQPQSASAGSAVDRNTIGYEFGSPPPSINPRDSTGENSDVAARDQLTTDIPHTTAKKQLSPLNGRTVCSIALVDALPRFVAPSDAQRIEMRQRHANSASALQRRGGPSVQACSTSPTITTTGVLGTSGTNREEQRLPPLSQVFTSLQRLPATSASTSGMDTVEGAAAGGDDDVVMMGGNSPRATGSFSLAEEIPTTTSFLSPPATGRRTRDALAAHGMSTPPDRRHSHDQPQFLIPPSTASKLLPSHVNGADCPSPFSRASSCGGGRDCSICLGPLGGCSVVVMACLHTFHYGCAKVWLSEHDGSCPDCRTKVCVESFSFPHELDGDAEFAAQEQAGEDLRRRFEAADEAERTNAPADPTNGRESPTDATSVPHHNDTGALTDLPPPPPLTLLLYQPQPEGHQHPASGFADWGEPSMVPAIA